MADSLFQDYIKDDYKPIVTEINKYLNGEIAEQKPYYFQRFLTKKYSVTGMWESFQADFTQVTADYVALDSTLPLKMRDTINKVTGEIMKQGVMMKMNERQLKDLLTMRKLGMDEQQILNELFEDTKRCMRAIYENIERTFLEGLSAGVCVVSDDEDTGLALRLDFHYKDGNKFDSQIKWSRKDAKTLDDCEKIITSAKDKGIIVDKALMDRQTFKNFINSQQVRDFYAGTKEYLANVALMPRISLDQINSALKADPLYGFEIEIIDRSFMREKNGKRKPYTAWAKGMVIFTQGEDLGMLQWTDTVEASLDVKTTNTTTVDEYMLVTKWAENYPTPAEFTTAQACVVPVVSNTDYIYQLDSEGGSEDSSEGDGNVDILGGTYSKSTVIEKLSDVLGIVISSTATDAEVVEAVNNLSKANQKILKNALA